MAKLPTLPKIRLFGWRMCHEAFPAGNKLAAAGIDPGVCKMCNNGLETCIHAFRDCPSTKEAFDLCELSASLPNVQTLRCKPWLEESLSALGKGKLNLLIILLWNLWNRRNKAVHDNKVIPIRAVVDYAKLLSSDDYNVGAIEGISEHVPCSRARRWTRPPEGTIKVNVDAAFNPISGHASIAIVARESHGLVVDARAHRLEGPYTAATAEACTFSLGIKVVAENEWLNAVVEGDSMAVVNKLNAKTLDRLITAAFLKDAYAILSENNMVPAIHVGREANRVAHTLAHWAMNCNVPFVFMDDTPEVIADYVLDDAIYG